MKQSFRMDMSGHLYSVLFTSNIAGEEMRRLLWNQLRMQREPEALMQLRTALND